MLTELLRLGSSHTLRAPLLQSSPASTPLSPSQAVGRAGGASLEPPAPLNGSHVERTHRETVGLVPVVVGSCCSFFPPCFLHSPCQGQPGTHVHTHAHACARLPRALGWEHFHLTHLPAEDFGGLLSEAQKQKHEEHRLLSWIVRVQMLALPPAGHLT